MPLPSQSGAAGRSLPVSPVDTAPSCEPSKLGPPLGVFMARDSLAWGRRCIYGNQLLRQNEPESQTTRPNEHLVFVAPPAYDLYRRSALTMPIRCGKTCHKSIDAAS